MTACTLLQSSSLGCQFQQLEVGDLKHLLFFFLLHIDDLSEESGRTDGVCCQFFGRSVASVLKVLQG